MQKIKEILIEIPSEHRQNIRFLFKILNKVKEEEFSNKMGIDNLLIVPGPAAVLWDSNGAQVPINSVYTLMIERYDWIFNEDTKDPGNPLYSKWNFSMTSLEMSVDASFDTMMPNIGGKDQLRDFLVEDENVVKRTRSVRNKLKTNSRNRVNLGSGSFDMDFDSDIEAGSMPNSLSERKMRFGAQGRVHKLKMIGHSMSFDSEMGSFDTKASNTPTNSPVMSSLAIQSENGLSVSCDRIFEMTGSHDSDDDDLHIK